MSQARLAFAVNASYGIGGQGEFLRMMELALRAEPNAVVYSRHTPTGGTRAVNLPLADTPRARAFHALLSVPVLRGRHDWLTLLSDTDFDRRVAAHVAGNIEAPTLFDGVTAQCATTIDALKRGRTRVVVTSLGTHMRNLSEVLRDECRRAGVNGPTFVHPRMVARSLSEIAQADHIRVLSDVARRTFTDHGVDPSRVSTVQPAIDLAHFYPSPKTDDVFRVLTVSSIDPRKGVHYLLDAFVKADIPRSELIIIGGTGDRWSKQLMQRYQSMNSKIQLRHADVTRVPAAETYGTASVLVHPAVEDGFGLVVAQSLASGRPVIATRETGASELITHGRNGYVIGARDVDALVDAMRTLASDQSLWQRMCDASPPAVAHLTHDAHARNLHAFYQRVLSSPHAS